MPRGARKAQDGQVYHVLNRSVGGMHLFHRDADLEAFQHDAIEALRRGPIRILSYCILSNDWHFVVWPETDGQVTKKKGRAMRANTHEWEPGRRDMLESLPSRFVPPFPAPGRRNAGALPRKVSSCQTEAWDHAERVESPGERAACARSTNRSVWD